MGEFGDGQLTVEVVQQAQTFNQDCPRKPRKPRKKMLHYAPINLMAVTLERGNENPAEAVKKLSKNSSLIFQENVLRSRLESGLIGQKPAGSWLHGHIDQRVSFYTGS